MKDPVNPLFNTEPVSLRRGDKITDAAPDAELMKEMKDKILRRKTHEGGTRT